MGDDYLDEVMVEYDAEAKAVVVHDNDGETRIVLPASLRAEIIRDELDVILESLDGA